MDPNMEERLRKWWIEEIQRVKCELPLRMIKRKAREWSQFKNFKASKGWLDKFIKRYEIDEAIQELKKTYDIKERS